MYNIAQEHRHHQEENIEISEEKSNDRECDGRHLNGGAFTNTISLNAFNISHIRSNDTDEIETQWFFPSRKTLSSGVRKLHIVRQCDRIGCLKLTENGIGDQRDDGRQINQSRESIVHEEIVSGTAR